MTRALAIVTAALAAASLGASAQNHTAATQTTTAAVQSVQEHPSATTQAAQGTQDPATSKANQGIQNPDTANDDSPNRAQLPQTSTILPLLGLIGLGSLLAGLFARR